MPLGPEPAAGAFQRRLDRRDAASQVLADLDQQEHLSESDRQFQQRLRDARLDLRARGPLPYPKTRGCGDDSPEHRREVTALIAARVTSPWHSTEIGLRCPVRVSTTGARHVL